MTRQRAQDFSRLRDLVLSAHDVECGLHSGIPPCCVRHYAHVWRFWSEPQTLPHRALIAAGERRMSRRAGRAQRWDYIPCPACARSLHRVRVRPCKDEDHHTTKGCLGRILEAVNTLGGPKAWLPKYPHPPKKGPSPR